MDWQTVLLVILALIVAWVVVFLLVGAFLYWRYRQSTERGLIRRVGKLDFRDKLSLASDIFRDRRVGIMPRLVTIGLVLYVAMPFDLIPDFIPVLGHLDDFVILGVAAWVLVRSIPPEVIEEHLQKYEFIEGEARRADKILTGGPS